MYYLNLNLQLSKNTNSLLYACFKFSTFVIKFEIKENQNGNVSRTLIWIRSVIDIGTYRCTSQPSSTANYQMLPLKAFFIITDQKWLMHNLSKFIKISLIDIQIFSFGTQPDNTFPSNTCRSQSFFHNSRRTSSFVTFHPSSNFFFHYSPSPGPYWDQPIYIPRLCRKCCRTRQAFRTSGTDHRQRSVRQARETRTTRGDWGGGRLRYLGMGWTSGRRGLPDHQLHRRNETGWWFHMDQR